MSDWLRDLAEKATPAPWEVMIDRNGDPHIVHRDARGLSELQIEDARLIALAPGLARVAADLADALREAHEDCGCDRPGDPQRCILIPEFAALAAFDALAPKDTA